MEFLPSYKDDLYLAHHGIKGQKWGVRRFQNSDGSLTAAGRERYSQLSRNEKYSLKVAAKDQGVRIQRDSKITYGDITQDPNFDKKSGLLLQTHTLSYSDDAKAVNPRAKNASLFHNNSGYFVNCTHCTAAYDLRRRGYDVAAASASGGGEEASVIHKMYKNAEIKKVQPIVSSKNYTDMYADKVDNQKLTALFMESYNHAWSLNGKRAREYRDACKKQGAAILKECESFGPNARGNVCLRIACAGGHSLAFENDSKGHTKFIDSQTMSVNSSRSQGGKSSYYYKNVLEMSDPYFGAEVLRYDNATPDFKFMLDNHIISNPKMVTATDKRGNSTHFKVYQY